MLSSLNLATPFDGSSSLGRFNFTLTSLRKAPSPAAAAMHNSSSRRCVFWSIFKDALRPEVDSEVAGVLFFRDVKELMLSDDESQSALSLAGVAVLSIILTRGLVKVGCDVCV